MQPNRAFAVRALGVAMALALAGVVLVYNAEWGIGMSLFALTAGAAIA